MQKSTSPNNSFDEGPSAEPRTGVPQAGDADAVEKTTYTVGAGTDDRARRPPAPDDEDNATTAPDRIPSPRRGTGGDVPTTPDV
jgi:hypothetical protein